MNGTAEVFRRAAAIMAERGQWKGDANGPEGEVCLIAALSFAAVECNVHHDRYRSNYDAAERIMDAEAAKVDEIQRAGLIGWNDDPATTQTEVEKFFLHCADVAEFDTAGA